MIKSSQRTWFGTDGIRGPFGKFPMTESFIKRCGKAASLFFNQKEPNGSKNQELIIGRDTRESSSLLEKALIEGIKEAGGQVSSVGVLPTAAVAQIAQMRKVAGAIMISASHNSYEDNGIKFFGSDGFKLSDAQELELEEQIRRTSCADATVTSFFSDDFNSQTSAKELYYKSLEQSLPSAFNLKDFVIVADLAHGAAWQTTPEFLRRLGAEVITLADQPSGTNINEGCGSLYTHQLQQHVAQQHQRAIGLAHDGDADRLVMVDENGYLLDGDELLAIVGIDALERRQLRNKTLVATTMSNLGLDEALNAHGGLMIRTDVGDRYVLEAMRQGGLNIGGEQSGHLLFLDHFTSGDGLLSALQVLQVMKRKGLPLSQLRKVMTRYPQKHYSLQVQAKVPLETLPTVEEAVQEIKSQLGSQGRLVLRYSGTESKVRLLLEAKESKWLDSMAKRILEPLQEAIGVREPEPVQV